jgi:hypothetical protein
VRQGLAFIERNLVGLKDAGAFAEQTPYGPDDHTRRAAIYFDEHYGKSYLELSATGALAWLADIVVELKEKLPRDGKPVTSEDWLQHLQTLGEVLLATWLGIMTKTTPEFLRPIVNREKFQGDHASHIQKTITARIEVLKPPVSPSEPNGDVTSGLTSGVAESNLSPSAVELPTPPSPCVSDPGPADQRSKAEIRQAYVIPLRNEKGWFNNEDWAEAINKQHPDKPITARTLYNYLVGSTNPTYITRCWMADSLGVSESDLPH